MEYDDTLTPDILRDKSQKHTDNVDSTSDSSLLDEPAQHSGNINDIITSAIIDVMTITDKNGCSHQTFEEVLAFGKKLFMSKNNDLTNAEIETLWPKTWNKAQKVLKDSGYEDACEYYICFCNFEKTIKRNGKETKTTHYTGNWDLMKNKNDQCKYCGSEGYIHYFYLGINTKVKCWFKSTTMCNKILSAWKERQHWLHGEDRRSVRKELWDGERWHELRWFWDPKDKWMLPVFCSNCKEVISVGHIQKCPKDRTDYYLIDCPNCMHSSKHSPQFTYGSPLNLALLGHWDGWQPFGTSYRGSGAIELSIGNLYKIDRNTIDEVYVVGFIPLYQVPKGLPQNLDPFLKPLMDDLVVGFIDGYTIDCPLTQIEDYDVSATEQVRVLLLCWLGDHPGQCEVGKCLNQGKCGCRRCKVIGVHLLDSANNHFYYRENRYHFRYPWAKRIIESELDAMLNIEMEDRVSVRRTMSSTVGFTGISILHKYLYPLYGFNILKHLVYDSFHTVCLNVVKNQLSWLLENEKVDIETLERQLRSFPWNHEMKDGRIPQDIGKDMKLMGYWKAESFQKFGFPVMECILEDIVDDQAIFEIISLISRIVELHF